MWLENEGKQERVVSGSVANASAAAPRTLRHYNWWWTVSSPFWRKGAEDPLACTPLTFSAPSSSEKGKGLWIADSVIPCILIANLFGRLQICMKIPRRSGGTVSCNPPFKPSQSFRWITDKQRTERRRKSWANNKGRCREAFEGPKTFCIDPRKSMFWSSAEMHRKSN